MYWPLDKNIGLYIYGVTYDKYIIRLVDAFIPFNVKSKTYPTTSGATVSSSLNWYAMNIERARRVQRWRNP